MAVALLIRTPMRTRMIDMLLRTAARRDGVISFAGGLPDPQTFPQAALAQASTEAMETVGTSALQYDWPEGRLELRTLIAQRMRDRGATVEPNDVVITNGAQDALAIATEVVGSLTMQVDAVTYPGALDVFEMHSCAPSSLPGMPVRYVMPAVSNPFGNTMTLEQRQECLQAEVILEDDAYGDLLFSGPAPRPLLADAPDKVYFIGTFSKTLAPGLRVGWLIAPAAVRDRVLQIKAQRDLQACGLSQAIVERLLGSPGFELRLARLRAHYLSRRDRLLSALDHLPGVRFNVPNGGFSVWVETDVPGTDAGFLYSALENGVAFDPGELFLVRPDLHPTLSLRLSFSSVPIDQIDEGVRRLARALRHSRSLNLAA